VSSSHFSAAQRSGGRSPPLHKRSRRYRGSVVFSPSLQPWRRFGKGSESWATSKGKRLYWKSARRRGAQSGFPRAYETAALAGFKDIKTTADLSWVVTPDENTRRAEALRAMLARAPERGKNDILVTHRPNIVDALGKDWFDVEEGEASIFKPDGADLHLVARVLMDDWPKIADAVR